MNENVKQAEHHIREALAMLRFSQDPRASMPLAERLGNVRRQLAKAVAQLDAAIEGPER